MITIKIDLDKKCVRCKKGGALENGLCMRCITKAIDRGEYNHIFKKAKETLASDSIPRKGDKN